MTNSVIASGLAGLQSGMAKVAQEAEKLSRPDTFTSADSEADPVSSMVNIKTALHQAEASAKVIKVGKELDDSVLDIIA
jgi:hypothetical protein